jgi:AmmeMemoRadiSam system protein A/AmmeMemoRadiSam system protein B
MLRGYLLPHPPLLVPGVGTGDEIPDTRRAFLEIAAEIREQNPDTVVMISPHSILYEDYFHIAPGAEATGDFGAFRAAKIKLAVDYDAELAALTGELAQQQDLPAGPLGDKQRELDHGVMVPLYFLQAPRIVRISLSGLPLLEHYRLGMCISAAAGRLGRRIAVVASGDMSHRLQEDGPYGFDPAGPRHDELVCACVRDADVERLLDISPQLSEQAGECGLRSLVMMLGALDGLRIQSRLLCYEGPFGVGYLTAAFGGAGEAPSLLPRLLEARAARLAQTRAAEDAYVGLARLNIEHYVRHGRSAGLPAGLPPEMLSQRAGVFVSIKKQGRLRGCIGTIAPTRAHIAAEILENSVAAACRDPRFDPIQPDELDDLAYSVDVLAPAEPIAGPQELDVRRYGVIVVSGRKRGLLLPNLEGVDTVEQQIGIARQKAGIGPRDSYSLERFEVVRHT